jgi:tellurite resistance protein TerC
LIYKTARKIIVLVIGGTALLFGVIMLITPGPGLLAIFAGLAILATEFVWARVFLRRLKERCSDALNAKRNGAEAGR